MSETPTPLPDHALLSQSGATWEIFCRVIDNHGDLGVCWRLARDLARRGARPRLWVDDASALAWMAGAGRTEGEIAGVRVMPWPAGEAAFSATVATVATEFAQEPLGEWVIEAFGCELPVPVLQAMAERQRAGLPLRWFNLEYLSAEPYVERSHLLRSPQFSGPAQGLEKRFFYPGFTPRTGGLLREPDVLQRQARFDAPAWLGRMANSLQSATPWASAGREGERHISLFCYSTAPVARLLHSLRASPQPHTLWVTPGKAWQSVCAVLGDAALASGHHQAGALRVLALPYLSQCGFDELLWACDLNLVRGEDSFVRAQWAGKPWLWNLYPQDDGVQGPKLQAFHQLVNASLQPAPLAGASPWQALERLWNQPSTHPPPQLSPQLSPQPSALNPAWAQAWERCFQAENWKAWQAQAQAWRQHLLGQDDLLTQLHRAGSASVG
jgi:uncharacterized repeat protein (TIGR03837 family)